jgi:hypothetical protein
VVAEGDVPPFERIEQPLVERSVVPVVGTLVLGDGFEEGDQRLVDEPTVSSALGAGRHDVPHPVRTLRGPATDRADVRIGHTSSSGAELLNGCAPSDRVQTIEGDDENEGRDSSGRPALDVDGSPVTGRPGIVRRAREHSAPDDECALTPERTIDDVEEWPSYDLF